jgi:hypothetical protein
MKDPEDDVTEIRPVLDDSLVMYQKKPNKEKTPAPNRRKNKNKNPRK